MDRIERHDFVNAALLAIVLLGMALALVVVTRSLFGALEDEPIVNAEPVPEAVTTTTATPSVTVGEDITEETPVTEPARSPNEVSIRVGNGSGKSGVAGRGSTVLANAGYTMLSAKDSTIKLASTVVYFAEGYAADAEVVATLLNVPITSIAPMPADPGVAIESATVVVILGGDTTV